MRAIVASSFKFLGADKKLAVPAIREAAKDENSIVRKMALETLQFIDPDERKKDKR
jgi:HEAT repeat protein